MSEHQLTLAQARTVLLTAQGLPGGPGRAAAEVVRDRGFVRALGGVDVYLALRARASDLTRERLDAAVADGEAAVIPAVRGCIYLVSQRHRAWALALADTLSRRRFERDCDKAGVHPGELEEVGRAIEAALADGPLTTHALRAALPDGTARSLGDAGKKVGLSSTLPPALRLLELAGRVERAHEDGRLDSERYVWRLPAADPFAGADVSDDPTALHRDLAGLYFRWAGLGTADDFAAWSGLGKRDARQATAALELVEVEVDGWEGSRLGFAEALDAAGNEEAVTAGAALLPFEDNLVHLQGGPAALVNAEHHGVEVPIWSSRSKPTPLGEARHMQFRSVVAGGRMVGFWEYDPGAGEVVLGLFDDPGDAAREELRAAATDTARFLREEMGHGKSFSIDTDEAMRERCERLREMG